MDNKPIGRIVPLSTPNPEIQKLLKSEPRGTLYTYDGSIAFPNGTHTLRNIAIGLSREGRYAGAGMRWWPVGLHTFIVCDLLPDELKFDGLMHDSPEYITGDAPKPTKTDEYEKMEEQLLKDIYHSFKVTFPTPKIRKQIKVVDKNVLRGEVFTVGTQALQDIHYRYPEAEELVYKYLNMYSYEDCLDAGGKVPIEFMRRFRSYKDLLPQNRIIL
jgi:hypothetical protein